MLDGDPVIRSLTERVRRHQQQISELMTENAGLRAALKGLLEQWDRGPLAEIDYSVIDAARAVTALEQKDSSK